MCRGVAAAAPEVLREFREPLLDAFDSGVAVLGSEWAGVCGLVAEGVRIGELQGEDDIEKLLTSKDVVGGGASGEV